MFGSDFGPVPYGIKEQVQKVFASEAERDASSTITNGVLLLHGAARIEGGISWKR